MARVTKKGQRSRAAAAAAEAEAAGAEVEAAGVEVEAAGAEVEAAAASAAKAKRSKLKKTAAKRFNLKKNNPRSKLPNPSPHALIHSLTCFCSCRYCRRSCSKITLQITKKGEQSLRRRIRRGMKSASELQLMQNQVELNQLEQNQVEQNQLELIEPEPAVSVEPSETPLELFSYENDNVSELEEVPPGLDSDSVFTGDLASS